MPEAQATSDAGVNLNAMLPTEGAEQSATSGEQSATGTEQKADDKGTEQSATGTEQKADDKGTEQKADERVVPETYEFKMPEGIEVDKSAADELTAIGKELKWSQQEMDRVAQVGAKMAQRQAEAFNQQVTEWAKASSTDPEFGGAKFAENSAIGRKALEAFGTKELTETLRNSGMGNHPEVMRFFYRVGKAMGDDTFVTGGNARDGKEANDARGMFPNSQMNA